MLDNLFWIIRQGLIIPKIGAENLHYIYLDLDVDTSTERLTQRNGEVTHFDTLPREFHERVRAGGHEFMTKITQGLGEDLKTCHVVDATRSVGLVHKDILDIVETNTAT